MDSGLECQNPVKEVVGGMGSGLVGLHLKDIRQGEYFYHLANLGRAKPTRVSKLPDGKTVATH